MKNMQYSILMMSVLLGCMQTTCAVKQAIKKFERKKEYEETSGNFFQLNNLGKSLLLGITCISAGVLVEGLHVYVQATKDHLAYPCNTLCGQDECCDMQEDVKNHMKHGIICITSGTFFLLASYGLMVHHAKRAFQ